MHNIYYSVEGTDWRLWGKMMRVKLEDVCERASSNLRQSDVENKTGDYRKYQKYVLLPFQRLSVLMKWI